MQRITIEKIGSFFKLMVYNGDKRIDDMLKNFDVPIRLFPKGESNIDKINEQMVNLGINVDQIISIVVVTINPDFTKFFDQEVTRIFYKD